MKLKETEFEEITTDKESSFRIMVNPNLSDLFFWHFHPEYELVFIDGPPVGTRYVGHHISQYSGSDLVFIGSNIPHLNFDYGVNKPYEKIVVQIKQDFFRETLENTPELVHIAQLFNDSARGIAFGNESKEKIGPRLKELHTYSHFDQFLVFMDILQVLGLANDKTYLHAKPFETRHNRRDKDKLKNVYSYIEANFQHKISNASIAAKSNMTKEAFCRFFKRMTKLTFTEFVNQYRIDKAKKLLMLDNNITETCFSCGFDSLSYFNRVFKKFTGENPLTFKKRFVHL